MRDPDSYINPDWKVPNHVKAVVTTRQGGCSVGPYDSFNIASHVDDISTSVATNRSKLSRDLGFQNEPIWLNQIHSPTVVIANLSNIGAQADASISTDFDMACVVMTADCLPVLFYNHERDVVGAAHAGWRGLSAGILEQMVKALGVGRISAWFGPAIGPEHFEVGPEVYAAFVQRDASQASNFKQTSENKWLADIYKIAQRRLNLVGVTDVYGGGLCTFSDSTRFYSYRRDKMTGRMASLIWKSK